MGSQAQIAVSISKVMREAWQTYRRQAGEDYPFNRKLFAAHLRGAWSTCRIVAHQMQQQAEDVALSVSHDPIERRRGEIQSELRAMEYRNFIDWDRHRTLSAELFALGAPEFPSYAIAAE